MMHTFRILVFFLLACTTINGLYGAPDRRFEGFEINVVKEKYFQKAKRFELGLQSSLVLSDTFVYTVMASGILNFHFSESFGVEFQGGLGHSFNRQEKTTLADDFDIKTEVFRVFYHADGSLVYTPSYGKFQLPGGRLVYFDTFINLGGGMTGVHWQYEDMCQVVQPELNPNAEPLPDDQTVAYPSFIYGIGQRIFRNKSTAFRWDLRGRTVMYNTADSACGTSQAAEGQSSMYNNVTVHLGVSKFF